MSIKVLNIFVINCVVLLKYFWVSTSFSTATAYLSSVLFNALSQIKASPYMGIHTVYGKTFAVSMQITIHGKTFAVA